MVVALGPGKFEGNNLPIPRVYNDIEDVADKLKAKFNKIVSLSPSSPPTTFVIKRKRRFYKEHKSDEEERATVKRGVVRKLCDDFNKAAEGRGTKKKKKISGFEGIVDKTPSNRCEIVVK